MAGRSLLSMIKLIGTVVGEAEANLATMEERHLRKALENVGGPAQHAQYASSRAADQSSDVQEICIANEEDRRGCLRRACEWPRNDPAVHVRPVGRTNRG